MTPYPYPSRFLRSLLAGSSVLALALSACGGESLSTYDSGSDLLDDVIATGVIDCEARVYGSGETKTTDELEGDEGSVDVCLAESRNHYAANVQNVMSGEDAAAAEWADYDETTGVAAGENWYFDCLGFEEISKSQCVDLADELGGKFITYGDGE